MQTPLRDLIQSHGHAGFYRKVVELLNEKQLTPDDFSYYELASACGVLPKLKGLRESRLSFDARLSSVDATSHLLSETGIAVGTTLFQVVTGELISRKVLEGYEDQSGFIGDKLVTILPSKVRNARIAGFKALGGPTDVNEGAVYDESTFAEKFVTSTESKQGRILSITEELIGFDQTGEIHRRAMALGYYLRQERERTIIRAVTDADASTGQFVYRPAGTGQSLYNTNGSNRNYVGPGNTTSPAYNAAVALQDWTDIEEIYHYRATQVKDDSVEGAPRPIVAPVRQILVPEALRGTAHSIIRSSEITVASEGGETRFANPINGIADILSSPFIDEQGTAASRDWYIGDFRRQFVWSEIWPVQTFLQQADSEAAFERDVVLRVKARYYGGISAVDTVFVTKVAGG